MDLGEIYYALFRHKGKILLCTLAGILAGAGFVVLFKPPYYSEARLFVRYVVTEGGSPMRQANTDTVTKSPDMRGESIMESERQILTSFDLAQKVADVVGPERILPGAAQLGGPNAAATVLRRSLVVDAPRFSSVISIGFQHHDAALVQPVLSEVIKQYLKMHGDVHRSTGMVGDFLAQETDQLRARLVQTEEALRKMNNKAGVVSVDEAKQVYFGQVTALQEQIRSAQAEIAERSAGLEEMAKTIPAGAAAAGPSNTTEPEIPATKMDEFWNTSARLDFLRKREQELLLQYLPETPRVREVREQISETEKTKLQLVEEFPKLAQTSPPRSTPVNQTLRDPSRTPVPDAAVETARIAALNAKIAVLTAQAESLRAEIANVDQLEGQIAELRRNKQLQEANYLRYYASVEQSRINDALGSGKVSNITTIQEPTPPIVDASKNRKTGAGIAFGGFALGLAWALAIEMLFDRSVRRPVHIERTLKVPLLISYPRLGKKRRRGIFRGKGDALDQLPAGASNGTAALVGPAAATVASVATAAKMLPFHETLRDRLIGYFENRNLTHKPKLVAVTGLGSESGVTTIAAGLARSLSETGEGNVLLVDMTSSQGSAQQFMKGKATCGLDELLDARDNAHVQENLYVVTDANKSEQLSRNLPLRFTRLVPKLKASDFDYIIFDMPPVSQVSITPRLAGFMDIVLCVIESEKTDRDVVQKATALLAESTAHLGIVLNKTRSYVPPWLHQEFPSGG